MVEKGRQNGAKLCFVQSDSGLSGNCRGICSLSLPFTASVDVEIAVFRGSILCSFPQTPPQNYKFPTKFQIFFVTIVGLVIGVRIISGPIAYFR